MNRTNPSRINDDPIGNNRMQDLVWADFDADGDLLVSWRDRRNGTDSTYATSSEIWAAVRWKDSINFLPNFRISDTIVAHDTILELAGNDFMCIKFVNDTLSAVWGDTRDGKLNIWFQRMALDGTVLSIQQLASEIVPVVNVFPNPHISDLTIEGVEIKQIDVYNQNGRIVLTQKYCGEGESCKINLGNFSDGIYFLQITSKGGIVTKKVVKQCTTFGNKK